MRGRTAITMLLLLLGSLLAPAVMASITQPTPACCRAAGRHHCSVAVPVQGPQLGQAACPYSKSLIFSLPAAPPPVSAGVRPPEAYPFLHEFYPELFVPNGEQPHPERAPPFGQH